MIDGVGVYDLVKGINSNYELIKIKDTGYGAGYKINTVYDVVNMVKVVFGIDIMIEIGIYMVSMDRAGTVLGLFEISKGTTKNCLTNTKGIVLRALLSNAENIVMVRNHINNRIGASRRDIDYYKKLKRACHLFEMRLVDSIIVGDNSYYSIAEQEQLTCQERVESNNSVKRSN